MDADEQHLRYAIELAGRARANGNHPFGSILVDSDGTVVIEAENTVVTARDCTGARRAQPGAGGERSYEPAFLRACTLYTSTEPCAMCAGAIFWSGIGRVVFSLSSATLGTIVSDETGDWTLAVSCRDVFARGGRAVDVSGPLLEAEARAVHDGFWPGS